MARSRYWGKNAHLAARRAVKKELRRQHPATLIVPILFLVLGILLGFGAVTLLHGPEDGLVLCGEREITVPVGTAYTYTEEGYALTCLGLDATDSVSVTHNMTKNPDGTYTLDTSFEGEYYIAYTSTHPLFYRDVRCVRVFRVVGGEA